MADNKGEFLGFIDTGDNDMTDEERDAYAKYNMLKMTVSMFAGMRRNGKTDEKAVTRDELERMAGKAGIALTEDQIKELLEIDSEDTK